MNWQPIRAAALTFAGIAACGADAPSPEPTASTIETQCIPPVCGCSQNLFNVTITAAYFGDHITLGGSPGVSPGLDGDPYWLGICSDASPWCQTGTWTWTNTSQLPSIGPSVIDLLDCPDSYGHLWGYNQNPARNTPQNAQCGLNLPTAGCSGSGSPQ